MHSKMKASRRLRGNTGIDRKDTISIEERTSDKGAPAQTRREVRVGVRDGGGLRGALDNEEN